MRTAGPGYPIGMEPIPETFEALEEFGAYLYDDDLLTELGRMAARVRAIVPECVGLSLAYREHDVTFTLVATDEITAALDALQYLDHGPCVAAVDEARTVAFSEDDVLDEGLWHLFARGTAAAAVASTLTLPIVVDAGGGGIGQPLRELTGRVRRQAPAGRTSARRVARGSHRQRRSRLHDSPCRRGRTPPALRGDPDPGRRGHPRGLAGALAAGRPGPAQGVGPTSRGERDRDRTTGHRAGHRTTFVPQHRRCRSGRAGVVRAVRREPPGWRRRSSRSGPGQPARRPRSRSRR